MARGPRASLAKKGPGCTQNPPSAPRVSRAISSPRRARPQARPATVDFPAPLGPAKTRASGPSLMEEACKTSPPCLGKRTDKARAQKRRQRAEGFGVRRGEEGIVYVKPQLAARLVDLGPLSAFEDEARAGGAWQQAGVAGLVVEGQKLRGRLRQNVPIRFCGVAASVERGQLGLEFRKEAAFRPIKEEHFPGDTKTTCRGLLVGSRDGVGADSRSFQALQA